MVDRQATDTVVQPDVSMDVAASRSSDSKVSFTVTCLRLFEMPQEKILFPTQTNLGTVKLGYNEQLETGRICPLLTGSIVY